MNFIQISKAIKCRLLSTLNSNLKFRLTKKTGEIITMSEKNALDEDNGVKFNMVERWEWLGWDIGRMGASVKVEIAGLQEELR